MNEWIDGWASGWINEWTDRWMGRWMDSNLEGTMWRVFKSSRNILSVEI